MTNSEALEKIESSSPWKRAGGDAKKAWVIYAAANPNGAAWLAQAAGGKPPAQIPVGVTNTLYGQGMRHFVESGRVALVHNIPIPAPVPVPTPPPPVATVTTAFDGKAGWLVNASSASPDLLRDAGIMKIAFQIQVLGSDNEATRANLEDLRTNRWSGWTRMGWGTHHADADAEVRLVKERVEEFDLKGYVADTEMHHLTGNNDRTPPLIDKLQAALGKDFPLAVVTFCYSQFSQGQLAASRYHEVRAKRCAFIGEAYGPARDGQPDGWTWGLRAVRDYLIRDGAQLPLRIGIGDKSIPEDMAEWPSVASQVAALWVWAPEQAGASILALRNVSL
jgi:hypothetical protein